MHVLNTAIQFSQKVRRVSSFVHLGHTINSELCDKDDTLHMRYISTGQVNNAPCYFPRLAADVKYKLFR